MRDCLAPGAIATNLILADMTLWTEKEKDILAERLGTAEGPCQYPLGNVTGECAMSSRRSVMSGVK
jgi:hypothetical protein